MFIEETVCMERYGHSSGDPTRCAEILCAGNSSDPFPHQEGATGGSSYPESRRRELPGDVKKLGPFPNKKGARGINTLASLCALSV